MERKKLSLIHHRLCVVYVGVLSERYRGRKMGEKKLYIDICIYEIWFFLKPNRLCVGETNQMTKFTKSIFKIQTLMPSLKSSFCNFAKGVEWSPMVVVSSELFEPDPPLSLFELNFDHLFFRITTWAHRHVSGCGLNGVVRGVCRFIILTNSSF